MPAVELKGDGAVHPRLKGLGKKRTVRLDKGKRVAVEGELLQLHGRDISRLLKNIFSNIKYTRHDPPYGTASDKTYDGSVSAF